MQAQIDAQMVALIASSDPDDAGAVNPTLQDAESRLATPGSGLYARVVNRKGRQVWRSPSNTGTDIDYGPPLLPGQRTFRYSTDPVLGSLAVASRGLRWEDERSRRIDLTFTVAASREPYYLQLREFRQGLLGGVTVLTLLLLVTLAVLLRWVLRPLHVLELQIREVESGGREQLDTEWPRELSGVVGNLNALLAGERHRIARYRDTLGNQRSRCTSRAHVDHCRSPAQACRERWGHGRPACGGSGTHRAGPARRLAQGPRPQRLPDRTGTR